VITPCTAVTDDPCGISLETLAAADNTEARTINIIMKGIVRLQAGGAITRNGTLATGAAARPVVSTTAAHIIFGKAMTAQATTGSTFVASVDFYNRAKYT
jgi:hypothetical protein